MTTKNDLNKDMKEVIVEAIKREIEREIENQYEICKKNFLEKLEKEKAITLAGISLYVMKEMQFQSMSDKIVISLRTENKNA